MNFMKLQIINILYVPLFLIANALSASEAPPLQIYETPRPAIEEPVYNEAGEPYQLGPSEATLRIVNLWALWCVSCRKEMPTLDALSEEYPPETLQIETIAIGRNDPAKVHKFFEEIGVQNLPVYYDKRQKFAAKAGALALPHTIFLNSKGEEIARIIGEANYIDESMKKEIDALIATQTQ